MGTNSNRLQSTVAGTDAAAAHHKPAHDTQPDHSQHLVDEARRLASRVDKLVSGEQGKSHLDREMDQLLAQVEPLLEQLVSHVTAQHLPLDHDGERVAMAADKLMKHVAVAYLEVAQDASKRPLGINFKLALRRDTQRGAEFSARRVQLSSRLKRVPSYANWRLMRGFFELARKHNFASTPPDGGGPSVQERYIGALLLALADGTMVDRGGYDFMLDFIARHANMAQIITWHPGTPSSGHGRFHLGPGGMVSARSNSQMPDAEFADGSLLLDCTGLLANVSAQLRELREPQFMPEDVVDNGPDSVGREAVLRHLYQQWGSPPTRRHHRSQFLPRAALHQGVPGICRALAGKANGEAESEWAIVDESPTGFGLRIVAGTSQDIQPGTLIALQPKSEHQTYLGVVQRVVSGARRSLDAGIEVLGMQARAHMAVPSDKRGLALGQPCAVLTISLVPGFAGKTGLIAMPDAVSAEQFLDIQVDGRKHCLRVVQRELRRSGFELFLVESVYR
ncbi:MAG: hypothetical protein KF778_00755 [Rhodocyclaceae bacterium]|nr:hypothetical protein [Rhodocyclaceae bacterium]MBX3666908.1 hypothetical protein [Rhodocyclaceae bacterium]